jgi:hypothetical protein
MMNIAVSTLPRQHCSTAPQYDGTSVTHFRQHSITDSAPGPWVTQLSSPALSEPQSMQISSAAGASWSIAPDMPEGGSGHHRKGSQESVDFPGSLASDSICSTTFAGGLSLH